MFTASATSHRSNYLLSFWSLIAFFKQTKNVPSCSSVQHQHRLSISRHHDAILVIVRVSAEKKHTLWSIIMVLLPSAAINRFTLQTSIFCFHLFRWVEGVTAPMCGVLFVFFSGGMAAVRLCRILLDICFCYSCESSSETGCDERRVTPYSRPPRCSQQSVED